MSEGELPLIHQVAEEVAKRVEESKEEKMVVEETAPDEAKTALDQSVDEAKEKAAKLAKHVGRVRALALSQGNAITSTPMFKSACKEAFKTVDIDGSGKVDATEAYVAVLLFYSKLSAFVKGLTPPKIGYVRKIMTSVASPDSPDEIESEEFTTMLMVLFSSLVGRILVQMFLALFVVPILAAWCADCYIRWYAKGSFIEWLLPRPIVTNMFASAFVSFFIPIALKAYESKSNQVCGLIARDTSASLDNQAKSDSEKKLL